MKKKALVTEALDYTPSIPIHTAVERSQSVVIPCLTALPRDDLTPLEFRIDKTDAFIDLNKTYLELELQILKGDGTEMKTVIKDKKVTEQDIAAPINNIGQSIFENVDSYISDQRVTGYDSNYPWWTYIYNLFYKTKLEKTTTMEGQIWFEDDAGRMDSVNLDETKPINQGFKTRFSLFQSSNRVKVFAPLMLNKKFDKYIPAQTELLLRFHRAPNNLVLMGKKDTAFKLKIWSAKLFVSRITLQDAALRNYDRLLSSRGYTYPVEATYVKTRTVSKGDQNVDWVPFVGTLPKRIFFWQINHEAYNANIDSNIYNFQSFMLNKFQVFLNGLSLPIDSRMGSRTFRITTISICTSSRQKQ